jgi:hypothetical protein
MLRLSEEQPYAIVVAKRSQRSESWSFREFYKIYKLLFRMPDASLISAIFALSLIIK